jgi:hypothetical protein
MTMTMKIIVSGMSPCGLIHICQRLEKLLPSSPGQVMQRAGKFIRHDTTAYSRRQHSSANVFNKRVTIKKKGKVLPRTDHEDPEGEERYSSTLSLTLALDEGGWSNPRPYRFTPGKEARYPLYRRLDGAQGRSGRLQEISPPPRFDPRTVQPVASHYTDYAIPARVTIQILKKISAHKS